MELRKSQLQNVVDRDHIYADRFSFSRETSPVKGRTSEKEPGGKFETNFGITVSHSYLFVLLHLRTTLATKNILGINIPQICLFHNHLPYDILYTDQQQIRSMRDVQLIRMHKIYSFFLSKSKSKGIHKEEQCVVCFQDEQFLLLTDTDLFIACRKFRNDPFFNKIVYIRNRVDVAETGIVVEFDGSIDCRFAGEIVQSFLGFKTDEEMLKKYGRELYLKYLSEKIALFLNFQQNIRIKKAQFVFSKTTKGIYFFMDVRHLSFQNLTIALQKRETRLKRQQEELADRMVMKDQEYTKLKHRENDPQVKEIEREMNVMFYKTAQKFKIQTNNSSLIELKKSEAAFDKLFPEFKDKMKKTLTTMNVREMRRKILRTEIDYSFQCSKKMTNKARFLKTEPSKFRRTSLIDSAPIAKKRSNTWYSPHR